MWLHPQVRDQGALVGGLGSLKRDSWDGEPQAAQDAEDAASFRTLGAPPQRCSQGTSRAKLGAPFQEPEVGAADRSDGMGFSTMLGPDKAPLVHKCYVF